MRKCIEREGNTALVAYELSRLFRIYKIVLVKGVPTNHVPKQITSHEIRVFAQKMAKIDAHVLKSGKNRESRINGII